MATISALIGSLPRGLTRAVVKAWAGVSPDASDVLPTCNAAVDGAFIVMLANAGTVDEHAMETALVSFATELHSAGFQARVEMPHLIAAQSRRDLCLQELLTLDNARNCFHLGQTEFAGLPDDMTEACDLLRHFGGCQLQGADFNKR